ncbi:MAG: M14 family metallopeptidase [Kiloniellaceae bacterium]
MPASSHFSADYSEARAKFLDAGQAARARIEHYRSPVRGPAGEELFTDTAWVGPAAAARVLVTISATHGVEGFCGSGVQVGCFEAGLYKELPARTALLQIHAINPYGFAWLRRVTEDNVDLNRNFIDHGQAYPANPGYEELAEVLCPPEWNDSVIAETRAVLEAYAEEHGPRALQSAITGGQYSHPDGIFFGGHAYTWAHDTLLEILTKRLGKARHVAVIDYHTGLGPRGYGERICCHGPESAGLARAAQWYDDDITSPYLGSSTSVELTGVNLSGIERALPQARMTGIALEYGTLPTEQVKLALRADNWLHVHGRLDSKKGRTIKAQIREAFYQDADDWKEMVWARAVETQRKALTGLKES